MKNYVLSIDQGTTSTRALLINKNGEICSFDQIEISQYYPNNNWVEENAIEIYNSVLRVIRNVLKKNNILANEIDSIGITNQRETTVLWKKSTGEPVYNAIVWQCKRGIDLCNKLILEGYSGLIKAKTGLPIDPYFSASKIAWLLENLELKKLLDERDLLFGTIDTWILWKLTNGTHLTDYTNASRTLLFNINELKWDTEILDLFKIPLHILPEVKNSKYNFGCLDKSIIGEQIPINSILGDQQSALFGQMCIEKGDIKNTYGTGCFTLMNTGNKPIYSNNGLLTTIAWGIDNKITYALEGSVFVGGAVIKWLRDQLGLISTADESESLAFSVEDTKGVTFVSTFQGLGTPYWNSNVKGEIVGLTLGSNKAHIVRSALESIAFRSMEIINVMEKESETRLHSIKVDGGASKNNFLMQFQSDILNTKIIRPETIESTALGAGFLAGLESGFWNNTDEIINIKKVDKFFLPGKDSKWIDDNVNRWLNALKKIVKKD
jgi:glycerol kinase